jgi:2,3-bisphosphoglycerate-dependent phosphoglycerate mutase
MQKPGPGGRLLLVRHGESDWNVRRLAQGQAPGPVLTREGAAQCERAARELAGRSVSRIVSSDLTRARQSASILAARLGVPVSFEQAIRERSLGCAEGRPSAELGPLSGVRDGQVVDPDIAPRDGETVRQLYERVRTFAASIVAQPQTQADIVLVTHGGVIRVLQAWARGAGPHHMAWPPLANGVVVPCSCARPTFVGAGLSTDGLG